MANYKVEVDGVQATDVVSVSYANQKDGEVGTGTVTVGNTESNRSLFQPGSDVVISKEDPDNPGTFVKDWLGEVNGKPSDTSKRNLTVSIDVESKSGALEYASVDRPFIEMSNAEILRESVNKKRDPELQESTLHVGSSTTSWASNADDFSLLSKPANTFKHGDAILYCGIPSGDPPTIYAEYNFDAGKIPARRLSRLKTRFVINDKGGVFETTVEVTDKDGIRYKWDLPSSGSSDFKTHELAVEDADISTGGTPGTLRYEVTANGKVPEKRAFGIDHAEAVTFRLLDRDLGVSTDIEPTGYKTTRRLSSSILNMLQRFAPEDGYFGRVTPDKTLIYERSGASFAPISIDESASDPLVIDAEISRDYDVRNRVIVQGKGDIQAAFEDTASIQFYNSEVPKQEPIDDPSIRTKTQAKRRARGFLNENAWEDAALTFTVSGTGVSDVKPGQLMTVKWPSEGVDGEFTVGSTEQLDSGHTKISLSGTTSI